MNSSTNSGVCSLAAELLARRPRRGSPVWSRGSARSTLAESATSRASSLVLWRQRAGRTRAAACRSSSPGGGRATRAELCLSPGTSARRGELSHRAEDCRSQVLGGRRRSARAEEEPLATIERELPTRAGDSGDQWLGQEPVVPRGSARRRTQSTHTRRPTASPEFRSLTATRTDSAVRPAVRAAPCFHPAETRVRRPVGDGTLAGGCPPAPSPCVCGSAWVARTVALPVSAVGGSGTRASGVPSSQRHCAPRSLCGDPLDRLCIWPQIGAALSGALCLPTRGYAA